MSETMTTKSLKISIVILALFLIWEIIMNSKQQKIYEDQCKAKYDSVQLVVDSLNNEIFILNTNITRYEIALEMLEEDNSKAASEFYKYLSQTE
jgi:CII-binding regulator of phage lambda lysogenization HflD